jgi:hypothetical protein
LLIADNIGAKLACFVQASLLFWFCNVFSGKCASERASTRLRAILGHINQDDLLPVCVRLFVRAHCVRVSVRASVGRVKRVRTDGADYAQHIQRTASKIEGYLRMATRFSAAAAAAAGNCALQVYDGVLIL